MRLALCFVCVSVALHVTSGQSDFNFGLFGSGSGSNGAATTTGATGQNSGLLSANPTALAPNGGGVQTNGLQNTGLTQNSGMNPGLNSGMGGSMNNGMNTGMNNGMNGGMATGMNPGMTNGINPNMNGGMTPGMNPGMNNGMNQMMGNQNGMINPNGMPMPGQNGMMQNNMQGNGMMGNGMQNGMQGGNMMGGQNGMMQQNSMMQNGMIQNGMQQNGMMQNGMMQNGMMQNGMQQNGMMQQNGLVNAGGATFQDPTRMGRFNGNNLNQLGFDANSQAGLFQNQLNANNMPQFGNQQSQFGQGQFGQQMGPAFGQQMPFQTPFGAQFGSTFTSQPGFGMFPDPMMNAFAPNPFQMTTMPMMGPGPMGAIFMPGMEMSNLIFDASGNVVGTTGSAGGMTQTGGLTQGGTGMMPGNSFVFPQPTQTMLPVNNGIALPGGFGSTTVSANPAIIGMGQLGQTQGLGLTQARGRQPRPMSPMPFNMPGMTPQPMGMPGMVPAPVAMPVMPPPRQVGKRRR